MAVLIAIGVITGLLLPALQPNESQSSTGYYCSRCGLKKFTQENHRLDGPRTLLSSKTETTPSPLSAWYGERYTDSCEHDWQRLSVSSRGYLRIGSFKMRAGAAEVGCYSTPQLLSLSLDDRAMLNDLHKKDSVACQDYIKTQLQRRQDKPTP
ncbi:MAG: hypothetical protein K8T91_00650 [Planctomycetes bacterium]|nr:hypothetical protein [Planctomycetota bacterium]